MRYRKLSDLQRDIETLDGKWDLSPAHELTYKERGGKKESEFKVLLVAAEPDALVISVTTQEDESRTVTGLVKLSGKWQLDDKNRITFSIKRGLGKYDKLTFQGAWEVNENHEVVYTFETRQVLEGKGKLRRRVTKVTQELVFKGEWEISEKNKLTYLIGADSDSVFRFRGTFESSSILAKKGEIRYQVGVEYKTSRGTQKRLKQTIVLFGKWKLSDDLALSFEIEYADGRRSEMRIGADVNLLEWGLLYPDGTSIVSRASGPYGLGSDGSVVTGDVEYHFTPVIIPGPEPDPNPSTLPQTYIPYYVTFTIQNAQVQNSNIQVTTSGSASGPGQGTKTDPLYVLANGIGNNTTGEPSYILNLENDLQTQSQGQIVKGEDTMAIPLYFPWTSNGVLNKTIDVLRVVMEGQIPDVHLTHALRSMAYLLERFVTDGDRPVVAMGYSGGFAPLIEGLVNTPYNADVAGVIGFGAATVGLPKDIIDAVLAIVHFVEGKTMDAITWALDKLTIIGELAARFLRAVQEKAIDTIMEILRNALSPLQKIPLSPLPDVAERTSASFLVNVWGSKDILAETGIGGYRSELVGFAPANDFHKLFNIEILGASHFDYMREDNASAWNLTCSDFATRLMVASKSREELELFFAKQPTGTITRDSAGTYIVNLTGHP